MTASAPSGSTATAPKTQSNISPRQDNLLLGIILVILAVSCFVGLDASAKWLIEDSMDPVHVVFLRFFVCWAIVASVAIPRQGKAVIQSANIGLEIGRGVNLLVTTILMFIAVKFLPLTITSAIMFLAPLVICALSGPMLGEKVGWRRWLAIIIGFIGVLIIIQPGGASFHWAMLISVCTAISYALFNVLTRKVAGVDHPSTQLFYSNLVPVVCLAPFVLTGWQLPQTPASWFAFFAMGGFAALGHFVLSTAYRFADASVLAPFIYPQIIVASLVSWLVFNQPPSTSIYIGVPIIIGAGLYVWLREQQLAKKQPSLVQADR